jgi:hypothetical protein
MSCLLSPEISKETANRLATDLQATSRDEENTMHRHTRIFAGPVLGALMVVLSGQCASAQNVCTVKQTSDGFVALRATPSAQGRLVIKMIPDDMVVIDRHPDYPTGYVPVSSGKWLKASHYRGEVFPEPGDPEYSKVRRGWVHENLINDCG